MKTLFDYNPMFYNEVFLELEAKWNRKLSDHEKNMLIIGYKYGRVAEMENEIKVLEAK